MKVNRIFLLAIVGTSLAALTAQLTLPGERAKTMPKDIPVFEQDRFRALALVKRLFHAGHYSSAIAVIERELDIGGFKVILLEKKASILNLKGEPAQALDQYLALLQMGKEDWAPDTDQIEEICTLSKELNRSFEVDRTALIRLGKRSGTSTFLEMAHRMKGGAQNSTELECQTRLMKSSLFLLRGDISRAYEQLKWAEALAPRNPTVVRRRSLFPEP